MAFFFIFYFIENKSFISLDYKFNFTPFCT